MRHKFLEGGRQEQTPGAANHVIVMHEVTNFASTLQTQPTMGKENEIRFFSRIVVAACGPLSGKQILACDQANITPEPGAVWCEVSSPVAQTGFRASSPRQAYRRGP